MLDLGLSEARGRRPRSVSTRARQSIHYLYHAPAARTVGLSRRPPVMPAAGAASRPVTRTLDETRAVLGSSDAPSA